MDESIQRANGSGAHIRHAAPAHSRNSNGGGCRNSSIELLRIIAMFMILMLDWLQCIRQSNEGRMT